MADINYDPANYNNGVPPEPGVVWNGDRWGWPANSADTSPGPGGTEPGMIVWPKRPGVTEWHEPSGRDPGGPWGAGWGEYSLDGVPNFSSRLTQGFPVRVILDNDTDDGGPSGWAVALHENARARDDTSAAHAALEKGLASGLPDPSRAGAVPFARLTPDPAHPKKITRVMTMLPLNAVTDIPAGSLPATPGTVNVKFSLSDMVQNGKQYLVITGGKPRAVPVVNAVPVKDKAPGTNRYVKNAWLAPVVPGLPGLFFNTSFLYGLKEGPREEWRAQGVKPETGVYGPAGYTDAVNNGEVIVRFPKGSGVSPVYVSAVQVLDQNALNQRQEAEKKAKARAEAKAKADATAKAKAVAEAKAKAEAEARAKAEREALFAKAGVKPAPTYTAQMVTGANNAMKAPGAMVLNQSSGTVQMALAGAGSLTLSGAAEKSILNTILNSVKTLGKAVPGGYVISAIFHSPKAGEGSDKVPGRDLEAMFALNAQHIAGQGVKIEPGAKSVNLPVRGQLVISNGQLAMQLLKTGNSSIPAAVPVLNAVRDAATGLDKITVPAVAGAPARTILVNPTPAPSKPSNTGNQKPVPVTPVHTGTEIKPVETLVTTTTPAVDAGGLRDFIYWRPDAAGTGVEPVYVMLNDPLDSGRFTRRQLQKKYKHAIDFGISDTKINSETLTKFRDAIEMHMADKQTVEKGTYIREKDSKVYFNSKTNNAVVIKKDGYFSTGMKLKPGTPQYKNYIEKGVLL